MKWLLTLMLPICFLTVKAQAPRPAYIDTLERKAAIMHDGPDKIFCFIKLCNYYETVNMDIARKYGKLGLLTAQKLKRDSDICTFYGYLGEMDITSGDFKNGLIACNSDLALAKAHNYKKLESAALSNIGVFYQMQGNYVQSQNYFFQALVLGEELKNRVLEALCAINIASDYLNENNMNKTIFYSNKVLKLCENTATNLYSLKAKAYELTGSAYTLQKQFIHGRGYYLEALKLYRANNDNYGIASIYSSIISTYPDDNAMQLQYGLKAQAIWDIFGPANLYAINNLGNLGSVYGAMAVKADKKDKAIFYNKAENYLSRAIAVARQTNSKQNIIELTYNLASVEAAMENYKKAYDNLVFHDKLSDSVFSQDNKNKIASLEGQHDIAIKDKQLLINKLELANQHKQKWFLAGGLLTLFIIAALIYNQNVQRKKTNTTLFLLNNELDEANKVKTRFFSILNHDLRSPVASFVHFLQLQQDDPDLMDDAAKKAYSKKATAAAENLLGTMEDLLLWSKGQMENFKPNNKIISVAALFESLKASLTLPDNISLIFEQSPAMELNVDEHYLKTVMYNLTSNAVKALGNKNGGNITWRAWEERGQKYLAITDNGPGASEEAFKPLYDDSAPIGIKSGLGLHIVRDLAKAIKCQLLVTAKPGAGVEVKLKFA